MFVSFADLRGAALGSKLAFVRTEHLRFPKDGSLSDLLGVVLAFSEGQRAFGLSTNASGNGVSVREWDPTPVNLGEYGVIVTNELPLPELEGASVCDLRLSGDGSQGDLTVFLDNGGRVIVAVIGDDVSLQIAQPT